MATHSNVEVAMPRFHGIRCPRHPESRVKVVVPYPIGNNGCWYPPGRVRPIYVRSKYSITSSASGVGSSLPLWRIDWALREELQTAKDGIILRRIASS